MTKSELSSHIAGQAGITKKTAGEIIDELVQVACRETKSKGQFTIPGLGKLVLDDRKARTGRNPSTGEPIHIPPRRL